MKNKNLLSSDYDATISLLNVYLSEWSCREQHLWKQIFAFYYAILIIILFPNLRDYLQISLPIPDNFFRVIGLLLSLLFLYVSLGYVIRFQAIGNTYQSLINKLPKEFQRERIDTSKYGKLFSLRITYIICVSLFLTLFALSFALLVY